MHTVMELSTFIGDAKEAGISDEEKADIIWHLSNNPTDGRVVPGTGGVRKIRVIGRGKGKSGGYRTIHYYAADDVPIFLMALIDKGDRANISQAEKNILKKTVAKIADDYREGIGKGLGKRLRKIR